MNATLLDDQGKRTEYADRVVNTLCPYCGVGCQTRVHVKNDKILHIEGRDGPANNNRLCVKGRFGFDYIHHPDRLTVPLIRRDDAPKAGDIQIDRGDILKYFREASWEEALERAASGLKKVLIRDGGNACRFWLGEMLQRGSLCLSEADSAGIRDQQCRSLHPTLPCLIGSRPHGRAEFRRCDSAFTAAADSDCIIVIGARPAENHPVAATFLKAAAKKGKELIVMDPRGQNNGLARHATKVLQFKPGSDVALLNGMLHTIIEEDLYDVQYVAAHLEGFEALKSSMKDFAPEKMQEICGIDAKTIRSVARLYATSTASLIFWGMGVSQHIHGTDNARCLIALALTTGHIGRPGSGLHPLRGQNNVQGASDAGLIPMVFPDYKSVEDAGIRALYEEFWKTTCRRSRD